MTKVKGSKGQMVDAEQLGFTPISEAWSEYKLDDGKIMRIRVVVSEVYRLNEIDETTGKNNYLVKSTNVISMGEPKK